MPQTTQTKNDQDEKNYRLKLGSGVIWDDADINWEDVPETWDQLAASAQTNQTKND